MSLPQEKPLRSRSRPRVLTMPATLLKNAAFHILTSLKGNRNGLVCLPVMRGPAKGLRFELDLVRRQESAYFLGKYDRKILKTLHDTVQQGWVIWDVGTYLGFYTVFFNRLVGPHGKVVAIEPDPRNLERTRRNLRLNNFELPHYLPVAVGDPAGEIDFLLSDDSNSHVPGVYVGDSGMEETYRERDKEKATIRIQCKSLDQIFLGKELPPPNLIKIDIEGAELHAMQYVDRLCREIRPILILELHNRECDLAAWAFAKRVDYILFDAENGRELTRAEEVRGTLLCVPR
jgi:FkbM family methyltransferase